MRKNKTVAILLTVMIVGTVFVISGCSDHKEKKKTSQTAPETVKKPKTKQTIKSPEILKEAEKQEKQEKKVMLNMELFVQENNYFCGPAVVKTVLHHFDIDKTQSQLAEEMHTSPTTWTEYVDIEHVLNQEIFHRKNPGFQESGYHVKTLPIKEYSTVEKGNWLKRMKKNIDDGYPGILAVDMHTLYPQMKRVNHFVICIGYLADQEDQIIYFYFLDPFYGVQDATYGGLKYDTPEVLWSAIVENEEPSYIY